MCDSNTVREKENEGACVQERERERERVWVIVRACGYVNELARIGGLMSIRAAAYLDSNCQISLFYSSVFNGRCKNASSQYFLLSVGFKFFFLSLLLSKKLLLSMSSTFLPPSAQLCFFAQ